MSDFTAATNRIQRAYQTYRLAIAVAGTVAVVVGLVILLWPSVVIQVIAISIGAYAVVAGAIYLGLGIFSKDLSRPARVGRILVGTGLLALGVLALVFSGTTMEVLVWFIAVAVGLAWIAEGSLTLMRAIRTQNTNPWVLAYAIIAVVAGIAILVSPTYGGGVTLMRFLFGISFLVLGVAQIVRSQLAAREPAPVVVIE